MNYIRRNVVGGRREFTPIAPRQVVKSAIRPPAFVPPRNIADVIQKARERQAADGQIIHVPEKPIVDTKVKSAIVYIFPAYADSKYWRYAIRFLFTYMANPPLEDHLSVIVLNGAKLTEDIRRMFAFLPQVQYIEHDNSGWDIGAYQHAARQVPCDMMVFFSASTYFRGPGWLKRMREAYQKHGPALYGCMGNRGDAYVKVEPHIRTTGFWLNPTLLNEYPHQIRHRDQRYEFEHGKTCLTGWVTQQKKLQAWVVTWTGEYLWENWDNFANGMHRGDQSALMVGDRLTEPPFFPKVCLT